MTYLENHRLYERSLHAYMAGALTEREFSNVLLQCGFDWREAYWEVTERRDERLLRSWRCPDCGTVYVPSVPR